MISKIQQKQVIYSTTYLLMMYLESLKFVRLVRIFHLSLTYWIIILEATSFSKWWKCATSLSKKSNDLDQKMVTKTWEMQN